MSRFQELKEAFRRRLLAVADEQLLRHFQRTVTGFEAEISRKRDLLDRLSDPDQLRTRGLPPDILPVRKEQGWSFSLTATDGARRPEDALRGTEFPHMEAHSCSVCGRKFTRQVDLKYHVLIHTVRPHKCRVCKRRFRGRGQVCPVCRAHRRSQARERPPSCTACGSRFSWSYQAERHSCAGRWVPADPPAKRKTAPWSGGTWTGATYRRKKKAMESDERGETNSYHGNTGPEGKRHGAQSEAPTPDTRSSPQTQDPPRCSACRTRSTCGSECVCEPAQNQQNQQNQGSLTGKEPFSCSVCHAAFWNRDSLVLHMRGHTRLTRFTCPVCTKAFVWRRHLTKHMEVHQNRSGAAAAQDGQDDSSDCDTDDSDFWTESRDAAASRRRFSCSECEERFHSRRLLKVHAAAHQEQVPPRTQGEEMQEEVKEEQEEAQISTFNLLSVKTEEEEKPCGLTGEASACPPPESDDSVDSDFWKDDRKRPSVSN